MNNFLKKIYSIILWLFAITAPCLLHAGSPEQRLAVASLFLEDSLKSSLPSNAVWSMTAVDLATGRQMMNAASAASASLVPGSLVKLFTTAAVMEHDSKKKIEMDTIIAADGATSQGKVQGNLYLKGSGNAFLSEADLRKAIDELHSKGIRQISGDIVADDSLFEAGTWKAQWSGPAYSAPGALGLDLHTVSLTVTGKSQAMKVEPANEAVRVSFNPSGQAGFRQIDDLLYEVSGALTDMTAIKKRFALKDPGLYAVGTMKTLLQEHGIKVRGSAKKGATLVGAKEIYTIKSKSLAEIIKDTNTNSLNVVAENFLLLMGAKKYGSPGTTEKGVRAVQDFLHDLGMPSEGVALADGSGLSPDNRVTTEYMTVFLQKISDRPWFAAFYESLPRAGMDGTLKNLGYVNGQVRAKTGQLDNVYALAGYVDGRDGKKIAFSYIVNVPGADVMGVGNATGAKVVRYLAEW